MPDTSAVTGALWLAKLGGALAGSAISLAYLLPRGRREAAVRFLSGVAGGLVFGTTVGTAVAHRLGITDVLDAYEIVLMGAALSSLSLWFALGFVLRVAHPPLSHKPAARKDAS